MTDLNIRHFSPLLENAIRLASFWHKNQLIHTGEFPYFTHLTAVASILTKSNFDDETIAAGYCHDILQYTKCPEEELKQACGENVFNIVKILTQVHKVYSIREWENQKRTYINTIKQASDQVKAVAIADKIHNLELFMEVLEQYGLGYFEYLSYTPEKKLWYEDHISLMFQDNWKHFLSDEYNNLVDEFVNLLEDLDLKKQNQKVNLNIPKGDFEDPLISDNSSNNLQAINYPELDEIKVLLKKNLISQQSLIEFIKLQSKKIDKISQKQTIQVISDHQESNSKDQNKRSYVDLEKDLQKRKIKTINKHLSDEEFDFLLPAALQIGIIKKQLTNPLLQESLRINYTLAHRLLKELKRLHIVTRADSYKPRPVDINKATLLLKKLGK